MRAVCISVGGHDPEKRVVDAYRVIEVAAPGGDLCAKLHGAGLRGGLFENGVEFMQGCGEVATPCDDTYPIDPSGVQPFRRSEIAAIPRKPGGIHLTLRGWHTYCGKHNGTNCRPE